MPDAIVILDWNRVVSTAGRSVDSQPDSNQPTSHTPPQHTRAHPSTQPATHTPVHPTHPMHLSLILTVPEWVDPIRPSIHQSYAGAGALRCWVGLGVQLAARAFLRRSKAVVVRA